MAARVNRLSLKGTLTVYKTFIHVKNKTNGVQLIKGGTKVKVKAEVCNFCIIRFKI